MRIPLIAGNWKMYKTPDEARVFCERFKDIYKDTDVQALILAPAADLEACAASLKGSNIMLGAQNVHFAKEGAYTGETSIAMIKALGCSFSIVGHSERRQYFFETDEIVNMKAKALLEEGLRPIICVGEAEEIRVEGTQNEHVKKQLIGAFDGIPACDARRCVIAYEPIWAIGTGRVATPEQAGEMCAFIREMLIELYDEETADEMIIQYGGSVKPENISDIMDMPEIDGALVGGASLDPDKFMAIIDF